MISINKFRLPHIFIYQPTLFQINNIIIKTFTFYLSINIKIQQHELCIQENPVKRLELWFSNL